MCSKILTAKERIYNSAKQLYLENGFENTSIALIAKEAGVTLGLVTYHYKTKDIIASDMLNNNFETLFSHLSVYLPPDDYLLQFTTFNRLHFKLTEIDSDFDRFAYEMNKFDLIEKATREGNLDQIIANLYANVNPGKDDTARDYAISAAYGALRNLTIKQYETHLPFNKQDLFRLSMKHMLFALNIETSEILFNSLLNSASVIVDQFFINHPHLKKVSNYLYT